MIIVYLHQKCISYFIFTKKIREIVNVLLTPDFGPLWPPPRVCAVSLKWRHSHCVFWLCLFKGHAREKKEREERNSYFHRSIPILSKIRGADIISAFRDIIRGFTVSDIWSCNRYNARQVIVSWCSKISWSAKQSISRYMLCCAKLSMIFRASADSQPPWLHKKRLKLCFFIFLNNFDRIWVSDIGVEDCFRQEFFEISEYISELKSMWNDIDIVIAWNKTYTRSQNFHRR